MRSRPGSSSTARRPTTAAVSYTERVVVTRLVGDGDPGEDTAPLPEALRITSHIPGTGLPPLTRPGGFAASQVSAWGTTWPQPLGNDFGVGERAPGTVVPGVRACMECSSVVRARVVDTGPIGSRRKRTPPARQARHTACSTLVVLEAQGIPSLAFARRRPRPRSGAPRTA